MTAGRNVATSVSKDWCTPHEYVEAVRECLQGRIYLDPCSNSNSIVRAATEYEMPHKDGLKESWDYPTIYVNPPYGADRGAGSTIKNWLRRCAAAHETHGAEVLALVPVATNTMHWKLYVWGAATGIAFLYDTRLKFLVDGQHGGKGAPMSCAMVYWGSNFHYFEQVFTRFGAVVDTSCILRRTADRASVALLHCDED